MSGLAAALALAWLVGPAAAIRPPPPPPEPAAVPLPLDHDLFTEGAGVGPHYRMAEWAPPDPALPVPVDVRRAPDSVRLTGEVRIRVPAGVWGGRTLHVVTAGYGGLDSKGVAAEIDVVYAGGRVDAQRLLVGEQAWPAHAGASGRGADPLVLGRNVGGDVLTAAVRHVPLDAGQRLEEVRLRGRPGLALFLLAVVVDPDGPGPDRVATSEGPPDGYAFAVPLARPAVLGAPRRAVTPVSVQGERLVGPDGQPRRFWGVNLVGRGALPEPERAAAVAAGLAARGFDLVRLHHIDTETTLLNPRRFEPDQPMIDPAMLDRFDRFHAALSAQGISQFVEMWTLRAFREGEGVPGPEGVPVGNKYVGALWPEWRAAQKAWFAAVWGRTNPYTGLRYADDPAVALVELSNENSLVTAWANGSLERLPRAHRARADALWTEWLRRRYGTEGAIAAAWAGSGRPGLQEGESLLVGSVAREPSSRARTELYPTRRAADLVAFYAELEGAYYADLQAFVRELGFRAPTVCSTAFGVPQADRLLAACDVLDGHPYWDPIGESTAFTDRSILDPSDRWLERLAVCQLGKPCIVSEVNHTWPNRSSQEAPLFWATLAARQGLDAVIWFAWSHDTVRDQPDGPAGALDLEGRMSTDVQLESAAEVYRQVPEAEALYTRWWSPDALERDLAEGPGLWIPELVGVPNWLDRRIRVAFGAAPPTERPEPWRPAGAEPTTTRWSPGRLVVDGPGVAVVLGRTTPTSTTPDPARLRVRSDSFLAASLVERGGGPWLFTAAGRTDRQGTRWSPGVAGLAWLGGGPAWLERLRGAAWIRVAGEGTRLGPAGEVLGRDGLRRAGRELRVALDAPSPWVRGDGAGR